jgi:hypothetical protein
VNEHARLEVVGIVELERHALNVAAHGVLAHKELGADFLV